MKKILIVSVNWLGDSLFITPVFKSLKEKYPHSYIAVMVVERIKGVFEGNPYIDEVIIFDEKKENFFSKISFIRRLKRKKFDTVFLVHRSFTRAFICFLAGIKCRVGYWRPKNLLIINRKIKPPSFLHRQDYYLYMFEKTGIKIENKIPQFFIPPDKQKKVNVFLKELKEKYSYKVGINPSANWELKRWPSFYFSKLADYLIEKLGCGVIFIGAKKDKSVVEEVIKNMKNAAYNLCGKTDLKELAALLEGLDLFISNDSGPAHLAASLETKTLVLFGPTSPKITAPRGRNVKIIQKNIKCNVPCYNLECKDNICMKKISVEEVFAEVKNLLYV
jgi:lipopolysaccharide heptosyltransferase II